jgi:hypothetical protein
VLRNTKVIETPLPRAELSFVLHRPTDDLPSNVARADDGAASGVQHDVPHDVSRVALAVRRGATVADEQSNVIGRT